MYLSQVGCVQIPPCRENIELWSMGAALGFCFGHPLPRFAIEIFTALFSHRYPDCRCYVSATIEGCGYYWWGG